MVIVLEGMDGSGKTTLANMLAARYGAKYFPCPRGATHTSRQLYELIRYPGISEDLKKALILSSHFENIQRMNFMSKEGHKIVCDRSIPSFYAYQEFTSIHEFKTLISASDLPELYQATLVFLKADRNTLIERINARTPDSMDAYAMARIDTILQKYDEFMARCNIFYKNTISIDATQPMEVVHAEVVEKLEKLNVV